MVMEELMLVNPESTGRKRRRKQKLLQIIFPKLVRKLRANPEYIAGPGPEAKYLWVTSQANTLPDPWEGQMQP